jgi:hypothetical protein
VAADAVADIVHLIAELVENATVFSPPQTQVTLRTGRAGSGFVLEIDDRGLGLAPEQIEDAHRTLTTPDDFDPTRHDRLGLYVVGRLAARHGISVTLCRSPYGGTTAVVLLPEAVLAPVELSRPAVEVDPDAPGPPSRTGTAVLQGRRTARRAQAADLVPQNVPAPAPAPPVLPTRVRQRALAPELRTAGPVADETSEREVTPEEMRAVFGAFQRGLDRGRKGLPTEPGTRLSGPEGRNDTEEGTDVDNAF